MSVKNFTSVEDFTHILRVGVRTKREGAYPHDVFCMKLHFELRQKRFFALLTSRLDRLPGLTLTCSTGKIAMFRV